jgi:tubulin-specific chaperone D
MVGMFLQQLNEKIDRIRLLAGSLLQNFFDNYVQHFKIPRSAALTNVFGQKIIKKLVKEADSKMDSNLETEVMKMEMKIQETVFSEDQDRYIIYLWNLPHNVYWLTVPLLQFK